MRLRFAFLSAAPLSALLALSVLAQGTVACTVDIPAPGSGGAPASSGSGASPGSGGEDASGGGQFATGGWGNADSGGAGGVGTGGTETGGSGGASGGASGGGDGIGGGSTGGSGGASDCTPNPSGTFFVDGEIVFDETTCLSWMQANVTGQPYAEATTYCDGLALGGKDDWRIPTAGEVVSIFKCLGTFPPVEDVFTVEGDGIWTTTETGTLAGDLPKVCGAGQSSGQFYDYGQVGPQNTRCVSGPITLPDRTDCKTNTSICP